MRKKRTLSSFEDVADNINIDSERNINKDDDEKNDVDLVESIIKGKALKEDTHIFKGYYLENDVANAIDRITDGKPRGTKSELVNQILKNYFMDTGIM